MDRPSPEEFLQWTKCAYVVTPRPPSVTTTRPESPVVSLGEYRDELTTRRVDLAGRPGVFLDQSPTGAGKSYADIAAFQKAHMSLSLQPKHENCRDVVEACENAGIHAVAYPGRFTKGEEPNCWNADADYAQEIGLSVIRSVCDAGCKSRQDCQDFGYLAQVKQASEAQVAVATHARAIHAGLPGLSKGRDFVSVHENALCVLLQVLRVSAAAIRMADEVLHHILDNLNLYRSQIRNRRFRLHSESESTAQMMQESHQLQESFLRHLQTVVNRLANEEAHATRTVCLQFDTPMVEPPGVQALIRLASRKLRGESCPQFLWPVLLRIATGQFYRVGIVVHRTASSSEGSRQRAYKQIILTHRNLPEDGTTLVLSDATADQEILELATGLKIENVTPGGRLEQVHQILQYPIDITREASKERFTSLLRGILASHPDCRNVGIITHRTLTRAAKNLGPAFNGRVKLVRYFGSGSDRGSNEWLDAACDLVIVAGTPRIDEDSVQFMVYSYGLLNFDSQNGEWGELIWEGSTPSGRKRIVHGRGYRHPAWRRVHQLEVRSAIIQAAGRGRPYQPEGCDVVILSSEECGFPVSEPEQDVIPLSSSEAAVLAELSAVVSLINRRNNGACASTKAVASKSGLSIRRTQVLLRELEKRGLVKRLGERGGWTLLSDSTAPPQER